MKRGEAIALLKELCVASLIQPSLVLIEQRSPESCELRIKGDYDKQLMDIFLQERNLSVVENNKGYLSIFKP
jgi:hypothetical protein